MTVYRDEFGEDKINVNSASEVLLTVNGNANNRASGIESIDCAKYGGFIT